MAIIIESGPAPDGWDMRVVVSDGSQHRWHFAVQPLDAQAEADRLEAEYIESLIPVIEPDEPQPEAVEIIEE